MRTKTQQELIDIIRFEICGTPLPEGFTVSDEEALVRIAKKHDLSHLVYDALVKNGLPCSSQFAMQQYYASIWRAEQMDYELNRMIHLFEQEGIDFIPLKGAVMRPLYPEPWMRTSADIDILFREQDAERALDIVDKKLGYYRKPEDTTPHHKTAIAPENNVHLEIHNELFEDYHIGSKVRSLDNEIWIRSNPEKNFAHLLRMSDACFYFYHIAHMAKHLSLAGGCSIRGLIDLWLLENLPQKNDPERKELLEKAGLLTFATQMGALTEAWMKNKDVPSEDLEQFILSGAMYGTTKSSITTGIKANKVGRFILKRIFLPYDFLKHEYPLLLKHRYLTPLFQVIRWTKVFRPDYRKRLRLQTAALAHIDREDIDQIARIHKILDIDDLQETPNALV
jgi:hypothetical protein